MKRKLTQIAAAVLLMSIFTSCGVSQEAKEVQEMIDRIKYHVILEKINNESSRVADIVADANGILVMESIFEKLQSISSAYSAVTKYSYSCDIVSDVQTLSDRFDTQNLADAAEALMSACMDACLDGDELYEFYILTAHLDMCNEVSALTESMGDFYMPYLEDGGDFMDDCLEWKKIIQERMGE